MTEAELQKAVVDAAKIGGFIRHHCNRGRQRGAVRGDPGFPDLVLAREDRVLYLELKSDVGKVSDAQVRWLEVLRSAGVDARVVRPDDLEALAVELMSPRMRGQRTSVG